MRDTEARLLRHVALLMRHRRACQRGAIFVEAVIVISFFVLALIGLMYFRSLYGKQLTAMRLARSAALAYAMGACEADANRPENWIGNDTGALSSDEESDTEPVDTGASGSMDDQTDESREVMDGMEGYGLSSDGTILNQMTVATFSGEAKVTQYDVNSDTRKPIFHKQVRSKSYISCGDKIRSDNWDDIFDWIQEIFGAKKD